MQAAEQRTQNTRSLGSVVKGRIATPERVVIYGTEGIGKTTFAADAPAPIFQCSEKGTERLDVARLPKPDSWRDALAWIDVLINDKHDYRTYVLDTLDWIEPLCWAETCATKKNGDKRAEHIEDYGFAKGYEYALDTWRQMLARLDVLTERKRMNVILIAHSHVKTFKSPDTEDFQRYELAIHHKAAAIIKQWADHVLFAMHETLTHKQNNRAKGISTGDRLIYTTRTAAYDAKHRGPMPERLPLSWEAFVTETMPDTWRVRITALLENADEGLSERVNGAVAKAGEDVTQLGKIHDRLSLALSAKEGAR